MDRVPRMTRAVAFLPLPINKKKEDKQKKQKAGGHSAPGSPRLAGGRAAFACFGALCAEDEESNGWMGNSLSLSTISRRCAARTPAKIKDA
jgi:hypothetical protein